MALEILIELKRALKRAGEKRAVRAKMIGYRFKDRQMNESIVCTTEI